MSVDVFRSMLAALPPVTDSDRELLASVWPVMTEIVHAEYPVSYRIVSLLKHDVVLRLSDGSDRTYRPSGVVAVLASTPTPVEAVEWVPTEGEYEGEEQRLLLTKTVYGEPTGLPAPTPGILYLVSSMLASALPERGDLIAPDSGPTAVRKDGQVVAVKGFQTFAHSPLT